MYIHKVIFNLLCFSFVSINVGFASDHAKVDDLLDLPLDELFYIGSKSYEKFEDSPGVVSVIKKSQIERFGAKNLVDVLNYATSFNVSSKIFFRNSTSSVRSVNRRMLDGHTLILINGRPIRDSIAGSINSPIYSGFPIEIIDHVEIVRGPGSVLYGSNAYSSVVNIVTLQPKTKETQGKVKLTRGSYVSRGVESYVSQNLENLSYLVAGKHYESDGWNYKANNLAGQEVKADLYERDQSIFAYAQSNGFTFNGFKSKRKDLHINSLGTSPDFVTHEASRGFADIGYEHHINQKFRTTVNFTYNELITGDIYGFEGDGKSYLVENNVYGEIHDRLDVIFGWTAEYREAQNKTVTSAYSRDLSWFSQLSYKPTNQGKLIVGLQANRPNIGMWDYSPRISYNHKFSDTWGIKTSYGKAFRTPSFLELYSNSIGNRDLEPEIIRTHDLQFYYRNAGTSVAFTFYNSRQENAIGGEGAGTPYTNGTTTTSRGVELETTHYVNDEHYVEGSFTWQKTEDGEGVEGWGWSPSFMAKLGYSYTPVSDLYDVGLYAHYYSDATRIDDLNNNYLAINEDPDAYTWLTAKGKVNLNKLWRINRNKDFYVEFFAENLLDKDVYTTTVTLSPINSNLSRPGRTLFANLHISF
jgi:outer membrane receptor for ferrienterochelin and colicins